MAETSYHYSISSDFPEGRVAESHLAEEIAASSISSALYERTDTSGDDCYIWFDNALSPTDEATLDSIVASHEATPVSLPSAGGLLLGPLATPAGVAVVPQGTPGATSWGYSVTAFSLTGETLESAEVLISNGAATLGGSDFNRVSWEAVEGAVKYGVYRTTAGGSPDSVGLLRATSLLTFDDTGQVASGALPSEDRSGALVIGGEVETGTSKKLDVRERTSDDSTVTSLIAVTRRSSEVVQAGFGTGLYVRLGDDADVLRDAGALHILWSDPDTASPDADFRVMLRDGGSSMEERLKVTSGGQLHLAGVVVVQIETARKVLDLDAGIRGGNAAASSNNDVPSVTFAAAGESRIRWTMRPPQNYTSGDLVLRVLGSFAGTAGNVGVRWRLDWSCLGNGDVLPGSYQHYSEFTQNENDKANDTLFVTDFTIPAAQFDKAEDMLVLWLRRDGDHAGDTCSLVVHIHMVELRYTGRTMAGQPGQ